MNQNQLDRVVQAKQIAHSPDGQVIFHLFWKGRKMELIMKYDSPELAKENSPKKFLEVINRVSALVNICKYRQKIESLILKGDCHLEFRNQEEVAIPEVLKILNRLKSQFEIEEPLLPDKDYLSNLKRIESAIRALKGEKKTKYFDATDDNYDFLIQQIQSPKETEKVDYRNAEIFVEILDSDP